MSIVSFLWFPFLWSALFVEVLCRFILPYPRPLSHSCPWEVSCGTLRTLMAVTVGLSFNWVKSCAWDSGKCTQVSSRYRLHKSAQVTCSDWWCLKTVFQTEPVINEESEGIEQSTQMRSQGIIALSYRDWEVRPRRLPRAVLWLCLLSTHCLNIPVSHQEIVKTFEISEPVISMSQSQQRLSAWCQLKVTFPTRWHTLVLKCY